MEYILCAHQQKSKKIIWEEKMAISYKEAGVDKEEGYKAVELMKKQ